MITLSVSVVVYRPDMRQLERTLETLGAAWEFVRGQRSGISIHVSIIDNGGLPASFDHGRWLCLRGASGAVIAGHGNVGYGRGHNLALVDASSQYHLILNPDVDLSADALAIALDFFDQHPEVGLISPRVGDESGRLQYLCRRYPTLLDLFVRGFLPSNVRDLFARRLARYEMRAFINERDVIWDPPLVSGCFMLFRTEALRKLGGFDSRYFLYFEDYDLSLRTHEVARVAYVPSVRVLHHGGGAARKGSTHVKLFLASAFKFFNRFGWKLM